MSDKLRPGESRIVRHDPAPFPDWYSFEFPAEHSSGAAPTGVE
jgi:hypothetical protein